jgi:two-component system, LytTR family, response regulator
MEANVDRRRPSPSPPDLWKMDDPTSRSLRLLHDQALRSEDAVLSVAVLAAERALAETYCHRDRAAALEAALASERRSQHLADHRFAETMRLVQELALEPQEPMASKPSLQRPSSPAIGIRITYFRTFSLTAGEEERRDFAVTKAVSVLRYLGAHRRVAVTRDVLIEALWPGLSADDGRRRLHQAIYTLRQMLRDFAGGVVRVDNHGGAYRLGADVAIQTDVEEFEQSTTAGSLHDSAGRIEEAITSLSAAESLYTDDFLADSLIEEWAHEIRERLRLHYVLASNRLAELLLAQGQADKALGVCERVREREPSNEECVRTMMYCLTELGQRSLALRAFGLCESWLDREFGVQPSEPTQALYDRILSSDSP